MYRMTDLLNVFMAATMIPFIIPLHIAIVNGDYILALLVAFSGISSSIYHLHENQKHQMTGFSYSIFNTSYWDTIFINIDRIAAIILVIYKLYYIQNITGILLYDGFIALMLMTMSETYFRYHCWEYIFLHTAWHVYAAFLLAMY